MARDSAAASVVGETLLIGILCLFPGGILFSVSRVNSAKRQLEEDIAERKRAEQALRESERQMRLVVEASPLPIHVTRPATGEILLVNRATCELFGYDRQEILGKSTPDFYANAAHDRPVVLAELQERGRVVQRELFMRKSRTTPRMFWRRIRWARASGCACTIRASPQAACGITNYQRQRWTLSGPAINPSCSPIRV